MRFVAALLSITGFIAGVVHEAGSEELNRSAPAAGWYQQFDFAPGRFPHQVATGEVKTEFDDLDCLMRQFIQRHQVPGASIAVAKDGVVVFARGYGYADVEARELVQPTSLFRIASISKPITACAILQFVQHGQMRLDTPVLSLFDFETEIEQAAESFDTRWRNVTIQHLLSHTGGWDMAESGDPMSQVVAFAVQASKPPPADQRTIIRTMFK